MKINYFNADHTHALIDLPTTEGSFRLGCWLWRLLSLAL